MNIKTPLLLISLLIANCIAAQQVSHVYKIEQLRERINKSEGPLVVNFWATWCKPCIQELPAFDSLSNTKEQQVKVLLVCLDFKEELETRVNPFLKKNNIQTECVLLDEVNGNTFVNSISANWSGAIPATLFKKGKTEKLVEKQMKLAALREHLNELQ